MSAGRGVPPARVLEALVLPGALGAVFQKEVHVSGRRLHTYIVRGLYAFLLVGVAAVGGFAFGESLRYTGHAQRLQSLQSFAPGIAVALAWIQFFVLFLVAPALTAGALCDEVRTRSLALLLTTPLKARQIVLGKLAGRCVQLVVLTLIPAPLLLAVRTFGGLPADAIAAVTAIGLSNALLAAAAALAFSAGVQRASSAVVMSVVAVLGLHGLLPLAFNYLNFRFNLGIGADYGIACSSFATLMVTTAGYLSGQMPLTGIDLSKVWIMNVGYSLLAAACFTMVAMLRLRRMMRREGGEPPPAGRRRRSRAGGAPAPHAAGAPGPGPVGADAAAREAAAPKFVERHREVGDQPVLWREMRQPLFRRAWHLWAALSSVVLLLAWLTVETFDDPSIVMFGAGAVASLLMLLTASVACAPLIAGEREARTWEVLLATPLTAREIVLGKFVGALRRQWPVPALYLAFVLVVGVVMHGAAWWFLLFLPLTQAPAVLFLLACGLYLSLILRRGVAAGVVNLGIAAALWIGLPMMMGVMFATLGLMSSRDYEEVFGCVVAINPVVLHLAALDGSMNQVRGYGQDGFDLPGFGRISAGSFIGVCILVAALYIVAALGVFRATVKRLERRRARGG